jgi:predicted enzyme related to lactoylglutathione lyase
MIERDGAAVGGLYELTPEMAGVPPQWMAYVKVKSVDASAKKAAELGGRVVMAPMDVMTAGRMAVLQDPTGATFSLWEARDHEGFAVLGEENGPCWFELVSTDKAEATAFYAALFGWKLQSFLETMDYTLFKNGEQSVGGAMQRTEEMGDAPSHWMTYFAVADCDASVKRVKELGGRLVSGPNDIPQVGRSAMVADPDGAMFTLIRLTPAGDV